MKNLILFIVLCLCACGTKQNNYSNSYSNALNNDKNAENNWRNCYKNVSQNQQKPDGPYRIQAVTFRQSATYSGYFHVLFNNKEYDLSNIYVETSPSYFESLARKIGCTRDKSVRAVRLSN